MPGYTDPIWTEYMAAVALEAPLRLDAPAVPPSAEEGAAFTAALRAADDHPDSWARFCEPLSHPEPDAAVLEQVWAAVDALAWLWAVPDTREAVPGLAALDRVAVAMLGHPSMELRTAAVSMLAVMQDGHTWQRDAPFATQEVRCVGDRVTIPVAAAGRLELVAPAFGGGVVDALRTVHEVPAGGVQLTLPRCGFYDWRVPGDGTCGRIVAVAGGLRESQMHEVVVDMLDAGGGRRGSFSDAALALESWADSGVSSVLLFGALERDNGPAPAFPRPDAMASAVTCRRTPNTMLGGDAQFAELVDEARSVGVQLFVHVTASISASGAHRRYGDALLCHTLDAAGHRHVHRGTDGTHNQWEDQVLLNYRKRDAWELLVSDVVALAARRVDGVYLEQAQSYPLIMEADVAELWRRDPDGEAHYSAEERLEGATVRGNEEAAFWPTPAAARGYANPLLARLARALWRRFPGFTLIGQAHSGRARSLLLSGVVPRVASSLAAAIGRISGHRVATNGEVSLYQPTGLLVRGLYSWLEEQLAALPPGGAALQIKSVCSAILPYPALLYGRGAWPAVDLLFLLPGAPMTFCGEEVGRTHRVDFAKMYRHNTQWLEDDLVRRAQDAYKRSSMSTVRQEDLASLPEPPTIDERSESMQGKSAEQEAAEADVVEGVRRVQSWSTMGHRRGSKQKIRSLLELTTEDELTVLEDETRRGLGPQFGFDLTRIRGHYEHRAQLRREHRVFREGETRPVRALHRYGSHSRVFAFARWLPGEGQVALVACNFNDSPSTFYLDKEPLAALFGAQGQEEARALAQLEGIWEARDLFAPEGEAEPTFYSAFEVTHSKQYRTLPSNASRCVLYTWRPVAAGERDAEAVRICQSALQRLQEVFAVTDKNLDLAGEIAREPRVPDEELEASIRYNYAYARVRAAVRRGAVNHAEGAPSLRVALEPFSAAAQHALTLRTALFLAARSATQPPVGDHVVLGWVRALADEEGGAVAELARAIVEANNLGPVVFVAPELGRWSTVGGLGVMVDELTQGLAVLGADVTVISPYYNQNRKGQTDYLAKDNIHWAFNLFVKMGQLETLEVGVHVGRVNGVRVVFLHHAETFSRPYPSGDAAFQIRLMALVAKGSLEALCQLRTIPSLLVTNDWFSGLVAGYARSGAFGSVFSGTHFFHIVHNLDPSYEGRLYPEHLGDLTGLHGLPRDLLIDPFDAAGGGLVLNPSRAALLASHCWATVSRSYRDDLLRSSPLAPLLSRTPHPFGFPNGIPTLARQTRLRNLEHNTHETAKAHIQRTYFGFSDPDLSIPLFAFIGRVTQQKGVHLILGCVEELIRRHDGRILFLVGGPASESDDYGRACAVQMRDLRARFPSQFYADPDAFFTDGPTVNLGADGGLMPSLFEPGGLVQHEMMCAGTPVVAFKTGGLKDSVIEFDPKTGDGSGFTFEAHTVDDLMHAIHRAMAVIRSPELYAQLRAGAKAAAMDLSVVSWAWLREFHRLRRCLVDEPATVLRYAPTPGRHPDVTVAGTFSEWQELPTEYDPVNNEFVARLQLPAGNHDYKFVVDGEWELAPGYPTLVNELGAVNNVVTVVSADLDLQT